MSLSDLRKRLAAVTKNLRLTRTVLIPRAKRKIKREGELAEIHSRRQQHYVGALKRLRQRQVDQRKRRDDLKAQIEKLESLGPHLVGDNAVEGGTPGQRFKFVMLKAEEFDEAHPGDWFYSQAGSWTTEFPITGPPPGYRSDCSQAVLSWIKAAGLPDPGDTDFTGGYTGTLMLAKNGWRQVSREALIKKGWGYVVYLSYAGDRIGHHTEGYPGPGDRTIGHGDSRVNDGTIDLFGNGLYACFIYEGTK